MIGERAEPITRPGCRTALVKTGRTAAMHVLTFGSSDR